jgi:acyl carrier protein
MPTDALLAVMERLIADRSIQRLVARVEWDLFKELYASKRARPLLEQVAAPAAEPTTPANVPVRDDLLDRLATAAPDDRMPLIADRVGREVARILGLDPSKTLDSSRGFSQMGLDSLMALELRHRLQDAFGQTLPATAVFNYPTVSALAGYLAERTGGARPAVRADAPVSIDAPVLDDLSDQDAETLLASRLAALSSGAAE